MPESKRIAEIRRIAKEADDFYSGRWVVEEGAEGWSLNTSVGSNESPAWLGDFGVVRTAADHCAAFDPATAISLCDSHEAFRARVEALEAGLRELLDAQDAYKPAHLCDGPEEHRAGIEGLRIAREKGRALLAGEPAARVDE